MFDFCQSPVPPRESMEGRYCRLEPLDPDRHAAALFEADAADSDGRSWTYLAYGPFSEPFTLSYGSDFRVLFVTVPHNVLAARNLGQTWPNPAVGCVLVLGGAIIATRKMRLRAV